MSPVRTRGRHSDGLPPLRERLARVRRPRATGRGRRVARYESLADFLSARSVSQ